MVHTALQDRVPAAYIADAHATALLTCCARDRASAATAAAATLACAASRACCASCSLLAAAPCQQQTIIT